MRSVAVASCSIALLFVGACASENGAQQPSEVCSREGRTTVPHIEFGTSAEKAVRILERAGLVAHRPDVNFPYYVTKTSPKAGSMVQLCDVINLIPGDG